MWCSRPSPRAALRATIGKCMMDVDARGAARGCRKTTQASIDESVALHRALERRGERPAARRVRAALRRFVLARAARSGRRPVRRRRTRSCTRTRRNRATRSRSCGELSGGLTNIEYLASRAPRVAASVRGALRVGRRARAGAARRARRQGDALPEFESEARVRHRAGGRDARARHHRVARRRRRRVQQPPRHVRRDAARRGAAGDAHGARASCRRAMCCGWRRGPARARSGSTTRSDRSSRASGRPDRRRPRSAAPRARTAIRTRRWSTRRAAATCARPLSTATLLVDEFISVNLDRAEIVFDAGVAARQLASRAGIVNLAGSLLHRSIAPHGECIEFMQRMHRTAPPRLLLGHRLMKAFGLEGNATIASPSRPRSRRRCAHVRVRVAGDGSGRLPRDDGCQWRCRCGERRGSGAAGSAADGLEDAADGRRRTCRELRQGTPDLKVLYLTGFSQALFSNHAQLWEGEAFLEKPCAPAALIEAASLLLFGCFAPDAAGLSEPVTSFRSRLGGLPKNSRGDVV